MDITRQLFRLALLGAINHQITHIIVASSLFADVRNFCGRCHQKLGQLVTCHLCFSTWVGFLLAWLFRPRLVVPQGARPPARQPWLRSAAAFFADAFAIALASRFYLEILAVLANRAAVERRHKELLEQQTANGQQESEADAELGARS